MKCQIPLCKKEAIKEIHIYEKANRMGLLFLCGLHFKIEENWLRRKNIVREVFDLKPKEDDRIMVQFT